MLTSLIIVAKRHLPGFDVDQGNKNILELCSSIASAMLTPRPETRPAYPAFGQEVPIPSTFSTSQPETRSTNPAFRPRVPILSPPSFQPRQSQPSLDMRDEYNASSAPSNETPVALLALGTLQIRMSSTMHD